MADFKNEQEYHDFRLRSHLNIPEQSDLESLSDLKLAEKQSELTAVKPALIIFQNEWRRREKLEHHKLNKELIENQDKTNKRLLLRQRELNKEISQSTKKTIILASLIGVVGVAVGIILTNMTSTPQVPYTLQNIIQAPPKEAPARETQISLPEEENTKTDTLAPVTESIAQEERPPIKEPLPQAVTNSRSPVAVDLDPHTLYKNLAVSYSQLWPLDKTIAELKKSLNLAPNDVLLHVELGILYLVQSNFDLAEKELTTALSADPAYADAYFYLGELFFQTGQYTLAWYAMETARKLGHNGRMLSEKLQAEGADAEPAQYPWDADTTLISFRQSILSTQIDAELFLSRYQQGDLFSDLLVNNLGKQILPSGFVGSFTPAELQDQVADVLLRQRPYAEPVIVETEYGFHVVQRVLPFDLASWKESAPEKEVVQSPKEQVIIEKNIAAVPLCVENTYIDPQKRRVYAGAYIKEEDAVNAVNTLREEDFPAFCWETTGKENTIIYNAVAGQFATFVEAESVLNRLKEKGYSQAFISRRKQ